MLKKINRTWEVYNTLKIVGCEFIKLPVKDIILAKHIVWDMMYVMKIWRMIKGYGSNGQRSHSNNKTNKKNKSILNYRVNQFYRLFGKKRRDIFPSLVIAEYTNRVWYLIWRSGWNQGRIFLIILALKFRGVVKLDPHLLSKNIVTGVKAIRKKKKHNVAKKKPIMVGTIGMPILFSMYLYNLKNSLRDLHFKVRLTDDSRKKMGKKQKKQKKKKKIINDKKKFTFKISKITVKKTNFFI